MNANELANDWERTAFISEESKQECGDKMAAMLRQQQAEIEALKKELDRAVENYTDKAIENEALMEGGVVCARCGAIAFDPVITQTAKTLTPITDEEIKERVKNSINGDWVDGYYDGVRWAEERLRKAQEK